MRKLIVSIGTAALLLTLASPAWAANGDSDPIDDPSAQCDPTPEVFTTPSQRVVNDFPREGDYFVAQVEIRTDDGLDSCDLIEYVLVTKISEGPTWETSGHQTHYDEDFLSTTKPGIYTLKVRIPDCFWQVDFAHGNEIWATDDQIVSGGNGGEEGSECNEGPGPGPSPEPEPVNRPRAQITPPTCDEHSFAVTLDNENSDEAQTFEIQLNGLKANSITVAAGETQKFTRHATDGDRLQVFVDTQLAEANADLGRVCEEAKHHPHIGTAIHGRSDRHGTPKNTAYTGFNDNQRKLLGAFVALLFVGGLSLIASRKRRVN